MPQRRRNPLLALLVAGLFGTPVFALAQADTTPPAGNTDTTSSASQPESHNENPHDGSAMLGSVRVSATRDMTTGTASTGLPLTARETPQSLSTMDRQTIEERSLTSVDGVLRHTMGVMVGLYDPQRPVYYVRGFRVQDFQMDGLPVYSDDTNQQFDSAFLERVDTVRGANGIRTGVGVPSATVNMIRKRPGKTLGGSVAATVGRWDFYRLEADLNAPLTADGSMRSRFVVAPQKEHTFCNRNKKEKFSFMGIVEADLGSATTVSLGYQRQNNDPTAPVWGTIPLLATDGTPINLPVATSFGTNWSYWNRHAGMVFADVRHQINEDWSVTARASRLHGGVDAFMTYGYGSGSAPFIDRATGSGVTLFGWRNRGRVNIDALDVHATGKLHLGGRDHDLTVGMNGTYSKDKSDVFTGASGWTYAIPNVYTWDGNTTLMNAVATGAYDRNITQQTGLFASARWKLMDELSLLTGARVTNWSTRKKSYDATGAYTGTSARYEVKHKVTPYLGLVYDLSPSVALYGSHTRIFRPTENRDRYDNVLDPAIGSNSEIGAKIELAKDLNLNVALFQTKQDNFPVTDSGVAPNSLPDGSQAYVGMDGTKSRGFEVEVNGRIRPNWKAQFGVTRAKTTRNESDNLWANFPTWMVQLGTDYRFEGDLAPLSVGTFINWQSKIEAFNVDAPGGNKITFTDKSRALVDLYATWNLTDDYSLTAAVTNATNKRYWANLSYANYGEPRMMKLTFRAKF